MKKHENKVILITGGTSGLGLATAEEFIREGAKVIITGRFQDTVYETTERLGEHAYGIVSDASKMQEVFMLAEKVKTMVSKIDVLFLNAGYGKFAPIEAVDEGHFNELFDLHVKGPFFTVQNILPLMGENGVIIFNTSFVTELGFKNFSIYSAAKSAVQSFIKTFAAECSDRKIRVNGISPGHIMTNIYFKTGMSEEQISNAIKATLPTIPLNRFGIPLEIAKAVSFLASEDAAYIHAAEISIDGGISKIM